MPVNDPDVKLLVLVLLAAGLAGALWYFRQQTSLRLFSPRPWLKKHRPDSDRSIRYHRRAHAGRLTASSYRYRHLMTVTVTSCWS